MRTYTVLFSPQNVTAQLSHGETLLDAARKAGISINAVCGGDGICGRCKMIVKDGIVEAAFSGKISCEEREAGVVLACMTRVKSDSAVEIPASSLLNDKKESGLDSKRFQAFDDKSENELDFGKYPLVEKIRIQLEKPSLENNIADQQRVTEALEKVLGISKVAMKLDLVKRLPAILRDADFDITVTLGYPGDEVEILDAAKGSEQTACYVVIVDIGTTTVVAHLVDCGNAKTRAASACFNSQISYGAEVTARLIASEKKGSKELSRLIADDINRLIETLVAEARIDKSDIASVVCTGNTVMMHFLFGLPSGNIRRTPYIPASVDLLPVKANEVGISINPTGLLYTVPGISGWIGGDITAGILFTGMYNRETVSMLVDIGTNGEIVVGNSEWLIACSASAGPALEGANIACGIRAEAGAIDSVFAEHGFVRYTTINGAPAKGICGSGIIDAVCVLFTQGIIDRNGRFTKDDKSEKRILKIDDVICFILADENESATGKAIYISEPDIENVINAKAAIFAAMKILLRRIDLDFESLDKLYIGGAFGNFINIESAIALGLLPDLPRDKIEYAGNTSIKGAKMIALSRYNRDIIERIRKITTAYDLMGADDYVEEFKKAMFIPHTDIDRW